MLSFVVPCWNEEALIDDCLKSIILATHMHYPVEIIVVDNGSTDSTAERAVSWGATVISQPQKGVVWARQAGLEASKYDLIAFIDADNELPPDWVQYALEGLEGVVAASGPLVYSDLPLPKRIMSFLFYCVGMTSHLFFPMLQGGNFIVRKAALLKVGGFNTDIEFYGEDTATAVRLSKVGKIRFDFNMVARSSGRRISEEGLFLTGARYGMNYVWIWATGRPWTVKYHDHRPPK
jgi:glycosyltransferase involved in cell wall biosynthesis